MQRMRLLHHTHTDTPLFGDMAQQLPSAAHFKWRGIRAISLQNTHTNNSTHLLYNGGELQAELNDIISGY